MRDTSRIVACPPHLWHVQEAGPRDGPHLMLIHGAGGATQSFRGLFPLLAAEAHVIAVDLPGQGFTGLGARNRCGLEPVAHDLRALIDQEAWRFDALVGHSAGAAVALQLARSGLPMPAGIVGINAALGKFRGVAGWLFPLMARLLSANPLTASLFAATATRASVRQLLAGTGSRIEAAGVALYHRLATDRAHVDATLAMMAQWDLDALIAGLGDIDLPVTLIVGDRDRSVPPDISACAAMRLPRGRLVTLPGLGHLAHEEAPERVAAAIRSHLAE